MNLTDLFPTKLRLWIDDDFTVATTVHPVLAPFDYRQYDSVLAKAVNTKSHGLEMYSITLLEGPGVLDEAATVHNQAMFLSVLKSNELRRPYFPQQGYAHSTPGNSHYHLVETEWRDLREIESIEISCR